MSNCTDEWYIKIHRILYVLVQLHCINHYRPILPYVFKLKVQPLTLDKSPAYN